MASRAATSATLAERKNQRIWQGNFTPWWFLSTTYILYFVVYMGFRAFGYASTTFILHTLMAFLFIVACAWNLFHTPSHGEVYLKFHVLVGRIAMLSGFFVIASGHAIVLAGESSLSTVAQNTFMITGAFQIVVQALLLYFIRVRKSVKYHVISASVLFYSCAFLPAVNRMPQVFGFKDSDTWIFLSMSVGFIFTFSSIGYIRRQMLIASSRVQSATETGGNL